MPVRETPWPAGTPCWIDAQVDDPAAAAEFYAQLFGWHTEAPADANGYVMCRLGSQAVAAIGPKPDGVQMPSVWTTYLAAADLGQVVERAKAAGARFLTDGHDVPGAGRLALAMDSTGAAIGLWEAAGHNGIGIYNEPGALCWNELHTRKYDDSKRFYAEVFGYDFTELGDATFDYATFSTSGPQEALGGVCRDERIPDGLPNYWLTWFATDDVDRTLAAATALGANVAMPATDSPFGRMAVLAGCQGEIFGVIDLSTEG